MVSSYVANSLSAPSDIEFGLNDVINAIRRHKWSVAFGILAGLVIGAFLLGIIPPVYSAEAALLFEPAEAEAGSALDSNRSPLPPDQALTRTAVETIASMTIIHEAVQRLPPHLRAALDEAAQGRSVSSLDARARGDKGGLGAVLDVVRKLVSFPKDFLYDSLGHRMKPPATEAPEIRELRQVSTYVARNLQVDDNSRSYVIRVRYSSGNPELSAAVANAITAEYLTYRTEQKARDSSVAISSLGDKLTALKGELLSAEKKAQEMREQVRLQELRTGALTDSQTDGLMRELMAARLKRTQAEARLQAAIQAPGSGAVGSNSSEVLNSRLIQEFRQREAELQRQETGAMATFGRQYPSQVATRNALAAAQRSISAGVNGIVGSLKADVTAARAEEDGIVQALHHQEQAITKSAEAYANLRQAERQVQALASVYDHFLLRQRELSGSQNFPEANKRLLSGAEIPLTASSPRPSLLLGLGAISGLLAGTSFAVIRVRREERNHPLALGRQALRGALDVTLVPKIPRLSTSTSHYVTLNPSSPYTEALHRTRAALHMRFQGRNRRVVMVTSALSAEGKSSFCMALATAMVLAGETAVVVDCDLRKEPSEELWSDNGEAILCRPLPEYGELGALIHSAGDNQPCLVRFGEGHPRPHALLSSKAFKALIDALAAEFKYVILDTPPFAVAADALFVGYQAEECLMLAKWNATSIDLVKGMMDDIGARGIRISGLLINQAERAINQLELYRVRPGSMDDAAYRPTSSAIPGGAHPSSVAAEF